MMEIKKQEITEQLEKLDQVVGGTDDTAETETATEKGTFADLPRVDDNLYTPDVLNRT